MFNVRYPIEKNKILLPLESLRGIAAVIVSLLHFQVAQSILTNNPLVRHGDLMVDLFFVLSGFVIAYNYADKINSLEELISFQKSRFWRLYPLHILTLFIVVGIETARLILGEISPGAISIPTFARSSWDAFISNLFLVQSMTGHVNSFNGVSWSISTEFYTYIIAGLFFLFGKKSLLVTFLLISVSGLLLYLNSPAHPLDGPHATFMSRCIYSFFIGVAFYRISDIFSSVETSILPLASVVLMIASVVILGKTPYELVIPLFFGCGILLLVKSNTNTWIHSVLSKRFTVWLGQISYSIYMWHSILWTLIFVSMRFLFGRASEVVEGIRYYNFNSIESFLLTVICLGLLLAVSQLSYTYIEVPLNLAKRRKNT